MVEKSVEQDYKRYVVRSISERVIGGVYTCYDMDEALSMAKQLAVNTGTHCEIIEEQIHHKPIKYVDYHGNEVKEFGF